jgi:hypothetical protein
VLKILKVETSLIPYIYKLFPDYPIVKTLPPPGVVKFILSHNITFILDIESLKSNYSEGVILSQLVAEEEWGQVKILQEAVLRSREWGLSRKRLPVVISRDFEASFNYTLFGHEPVGEYEDPKQILFEVFNSLGKRTFKFTFFQATQIIPAPRLIKSIKTYLNNLETKETKDPHRLKLKEKYSRSKDNIRESGNHVLDFVRWVEEVLA